MEDPKPKLAAGAPRGFTRVSRFAVVLLASALAIACNRPAVLLLGIDGGDWDVIEPLVESGYLPNLGSVLEKSARANLDCYPAMPETACFCPPVWTTIFTGHDYATHGYASWNQHSSDRQVKALWNVLADYGGTSSLVAARGSWPPEPDADYVMTEIGLDAVAWDLHAAWPLPDAADLAKLAEIESLARPVDLFEQLGILPVSEVGAQVWRPIASDRVAMTALTRLATQIETTDLTVITIHATDRTEHVHWGWIQFVTGGPINETYLNAIADVYDGPIEGPPPFGNGTVASQYQELDEWLGAHLAAVDYEYIVIVSDHGMTRTAPGAPFAGGHGTPEPEAHDGIFAVSGRGIVPGVLGDVSILDVAPTVAHLLRLPVSEELPGRVITEAFHPLRSRRHPVKMIATWE